METKKKKEEEEDSQEQRAYFSWGAAMTAEADLDKKSKLENNEAKEHGKSEEAEAEMTQALEKQTERKRASCAKCAEKFQQQWEQEETEKRARQ
jgi:hypothetical protein